MDTPHTWHPGAHCVNPRWTIPVPLLPDELFSSWLVRVALAHGCDPLVVTGALWPEWRAWIVDLDRGLTEDRLAKLCTMSGIRAEAFNAGSLGTIIKKIADDAPHWPWLLTYGTRNRKRHGGLQICPACLAEDKTPYYRLQWRLAWHVGCSKHDCMLLDRCPNCDAVFEPHRLSAEDAHVAICASCKHDLREAVKIPFDCNALAFQSMADTVVSSSHCDYGQGILTTAEWFALARYFIALFRKSCLGKTEQLSSMFAMLGVSIDPDYVPATGLPLELLPCVERSLLIASAWQVINEGPGRLLEAIDATKLHLHVFQNARLVPPTCLEKVFKSLPVKENKKKSPRITRSGKQRSKASVMRAWARLQRKMVIYGEQ